ncbi:MAG: glycerol-3-phosphate acyltransferase, partial [Elusimicrobia bacterium]|nr:glycerol-3-phosphate acyltransferase [Elusimicrobiota bacterium]
MGRALKGIDIRTVGSGNVGGDQRVFRSIKKITASRPFGDRYFKGFCRSGALCGICGEAVPLLRARRPWRATWSPWVRFRGGKGVATSAGVFLALLPGPMGVALLVFALAFAVSRRVSVGSLAGAVVLPLAAWFAGASPAR